MGSLESSDYEQLIIGKPKRSFRQRWRWPGMTRLLISPLTRLMKPKIVKKSQWWLKLPTCRTPTRTRAMKISWSRTTFIKTRTKMTLKRSLMKNVPAIIPELVLEVDEPDSNGTTIFRAYLNQRGFKFTRAGKSNTYQKNKTHYTYY